MPDLSPRDSAFLQQRVRLRRWWPATATVLLLLLLALAVWLWLEAPALIDPWYAMTQAASGQVDSLACGLSAMIVPVVTLTLFGMMLVMILFGCVIFRNEDRYRAIIDRLANPD